MGSANVLSVRPVDSQLELSVPSVPGHPTLTFSADETSDLSRYLNACSVKRVHIQHWIGIGVELHKLIDSLNVPVDLTVHDHLSAAEGKIETSAAAPF